MGFVEEWLQSAADPGHVDSEACSGAAGAKSCLSGPGNHDDGLELNAVGGQDGHRRALTIHVQERAHEQSWEAVTCPSRLQRTESSGSSPGKPGVSFDPFDMAEDEAPGCTPMPRCPSLSQPLAPRKGITSPVAANPPAKLFPDMPHSCPPGVAGRRAARPVTRVRVKRSLNLASGRGAAAQGQGGGPADGSGQQQQDGEGGAQQAAGGVRKRSELFSPPMPRKFSRSMEDIVAAGIMSKLQLREDPHCSVGLPEGEGAAAMQLH